MPFFETIQKYDFVKYSIGKYYRNLNRLLANISSEKTNFTVIKSVSEIAIQRNWQYTKVQDSQIQTRFPSLSMPEDMLNVVRNGNKLARQHKGSKLFNDVRRGEMYYSQLYSVVRYPVPETFICEIPDVYIHIPSGAIVTNQFEVLMQSGVRGMLNDLPPMKKVPEVNTTLKGNFVSLAGYSFENYSHWIMDIMPRLSVLGRQSINGVSFIIPDTAKSYHTQSLNLWGIPNQNIIPLSLGWHRLEKIILCYPAERSSIVHSYHLIDLKNQLLSNANIEISSNTPNRLIYISRQKSRRKILNEDKLFPIIRSYGFDVVNCEDLSFIEQVKLFSEAKAILGEHGSGMNNQMFSQSGCKTIEIYNPVWLNHCILLISNVLGHTHWHTFGENTDIDLNLSVAPQKIEKLLGYIFENDDAIESVF